MTSEELRALIAQGEGQRLDFKRGVPSVKDLALAVICLANADGGKILLYLLERVYPKAVRLYVPLTILGLVLVLGLILYVTALDIGRIIT